MICVLATVKEPNCVQFFIFIYNRVIYSQCAVLWRIHVVTEREGIYMHVRAAERAHTYVVVGVCQ